MLIFVNVYSWTFLPNFFEISLCLTDPEQKISWHFFETGVVWSVPELLRSFR